MSFSVILVGLSGSGGNPRGLLVQAPWRGCIPSWHIYMPAAPLLLSGPAVSPEPRPMHSAVSQHFLRSGSPGPSRAAQLQLNSSSLPPHLLFLLCPAGVNHPPPIPLWSGDQLLLLAPKRVDHHTLSAPLPGHLVSLSTPLHPHQDPSGPCIISPPDCNTPGGSPFLRWGSGRPLST